MSTIFKKMKSRQRCKEIMIKPEELERILINHKARMGMSPDEKRDLFIKKYKEKLKENNNYTNYN